jgi:hypothetical protein
VRKVLIIIAIITFSGSLRSGYASKNTLNSDSTIPGLVAYWRFDETGGTTVSDSSENGNHGVVYGGAAWIIGQINGALSFDGNGDYIAVPDNLSLPPSEIRNLDYGTIAVWFKYHDITNNGKTAQILPILYFGESDPDSPGDPSDDLMVYIGHDDLDDLSQRQIYFTVHEDDSVALCFDSGEISLIEDEWYHYAVVIGVDEHRAYLNGEPFELSYNVSTGPGDYAYFSTVAAQETLTLGYGAFAMSNKWWYFNGAIDELAIFNRPLTEGEISDLYHGYILHDLLFYLPMITGQK